MICRFAGALPMFYSVAQHSIMVANLVETPALKMQGLMHDASEAFMSDLARPLKQKLSDYKIIENNLMKVIAEKFEFEWPINNEVHEIDMTVFEFEKYHLLDGNPFKDFDFVILDPYRAKEMFIQKFNTYRNQL
jgi:5'-deoxynucleotidase YfbR-like HD superfamily hydrolase